MGQTGCGSWGRGGMGWEARCSERGVGRTAEHVNGSGWRFLQREGKSQAGMDEGAKTGLGGGESSKAIIYENAKKKKTLWDFRC